MIKVCRPTAFGVMPMGIAEAAHNLGDCGLPAGIHELRKLAPECTFEAGNDGELVLLLHSKPIRQSLQIGIRPTAMKVVY